MPSLVVLRSGRTTGLAADDEACGATELVLSAAGAVPPEGADSQPEQAGSATEAERQKARRSEFVMGAERVRRSS